MTKITPSAYDERDFITPEERDMLQAISTAVSSESVPEIDSTGQAITTDLVFDMFAALVPDSPWSTRLLKIRDLFNLMGSGIAELMDNPHFDLNEDAAVMVAERDPLGWKGESTLSFSHAVSKLTEAHVALHPVRTDGENVA